MGIYGYKFELLKFIFVYYLNRFFFNENLVIQI
jgi:hypothetical protein